MRGLVVDSFAGGGGASEGIRQAFGFSPDIAINHDAEAIALHKANHPETRHLTESVWKVDPVKECAGRSVDALWLSPDCTHFSLARGAKPVKKNIRGLAWLAVRWAAAVRPKFIGLENVQEFQTWGPLLANDRPCPRRKGKTYRAFINKLIRVGYKVETRTLRACDYGAPTIRKRFFMIARCDGQEIVWPKPTHGPGTPNPYRTAAECIDWTIPCPSIFLSKEQARQFRVRRPLANATLRRVGRGVWKFVINNPNPFIVRVAHGEQDGSGKRRGKGEHALSLPLPTVLSSQEFALVAPFLAGVGGRAGQSDERSPASPYHTTTSKADTVVVAPFLSKQYGGHESPGASLEDPTSTVTARDHHFLAAAQLTKLKGTSRHGQQLDLPLHTVAAGGGHHALTTSHIMKLQQNSIGQEHTKPLDTVLAGATRFAEVRAFLMKYNGTDQDPRLEEPMHTVTSKERFGLVTVQGEEYAIVDIGLRMLTPRELYRAQGFDDSYVIDVVIPKTYKTKTGRTVTRLKPLSKTAQVRMCGNSVPPQFVKAIFSANLPQLVSRQVAA